MIKDFKFKEVYDIEDLLYIMKILLGPNGCQWDREQTHQSIRNDLLEEAYETADAIDNFDNVGLCEELGDLLLQVVFHSELSNRENEFNFCDVTDGICKKLINRHPHVFGEVDVKTSEEILNNWDKIKKVEKSQETYTDTLKSVPRAFPALMRAQKVQKRAAKAGFDWDKTEQVLSKVHEETAELEEAIKSGNSQQITEEFGDLLFSMVNLSRFIKVNSEQALSEATDKFTNRFEKVEKEVSKSGRDMAELSLEELDEIWDKVKHN